MCSDPRLSGDLSGDPVGLVEVVFQLDGLDRGACAQLAPQPLVVPLLIAGDHRVRHVEDRRHGAVVLLERDDLRRRKSVAEREDVVGDRAAEGVDRLVIVPDGHDIVWRTDELAKESELDRVRVLVLVDQHVTKALAVLLAHLRVGLEDPGRQQQEVVEVDRVEVLQRQIVALEGALGARHRRIEAHVGELRRCRAGVLGARDDREHRALVPVGADVELLENLPDRSSPVRLVEDREPGVESERADLTAQQPGAQGVEGAEVNVAGGFVAQQLRDPPSHLGGGLVRERDSQDVLGPDTAVDQVRHPGRDDARLAAAGTGEDENRTIAVANGFGLLWIECAEIQRVRPGVAVGTRNTLAGSAVDVRSGF